MRCFSPAAALALVALVASPAMAVLDPRCRLANGAAPPTENIDGGLVPYSTAWSCGIVSAPTNQVRTISIRVDKTTMAAAGGGGKLQVVFWNVEGTYLDAAWQSNAWVTNEIFSIVPPGTQLDQINTPWQLANQVRPGPSQAWNVQSSPTATESVTVATSAQITDLCEGVYTIIISARGNNGANALNQASTAGVLWRVVDDLYSPVATLSGMTASSALVNEFFPRTGSTFGTVNYELEGHNWATYRYMLKSFQATITGPRWVVAPLDPTDTSNVRDTLATSVVAEDTSTWGAGSPWIKTTPGGATATFTTTYNLSATNTPQALQAQFSYSPAAPVASGAVVLRVSSTNAQALISESGQYQWKDIGPFVDLTAQITDATEFPTLSSANIVLTPNGTFEEENTVYMLSTSDPLVYQMGAALTGVTAALRFANPLTTVPVADGHIATTYLLANPGTAQTVSADGFGSGSATAPAVPSHMSTYYTSATPPARGSATFSSLPVQWSGSSGLSRPYFAFVQFSGAACTAANANAHLFYSATVSADVLSAKVECASHYDCAGQPGPHPSRERAKYSANGDANRFSTCYLHFDTTSFGVSKPSTRCMECAPAPTGQGNDLECNEGQFCWKDYGLCLSGTSTYVCDQEANSWIGTCRNKSTQVLGHKCRDIGVGTVSSVRTNNNPAIGAAGETPAGLGATFRSLTARNGFAPGAGFCGEVRFFNETGLGSFEQVSSTPLFRMNGTTRSILWTGSCVAGMCRECNPSSSPNDNVPTNGKTCVNSRLVMPITIDGTARTVVLSATGSAAAVTAAFAVLLFLIALCAMQNAGNRHRELYGENPMSIMDIIKAVTYEWMCCLKGESERARIARFSGKSASTYGASAPTPGAGATPAAPLTTGPAAGATVNPLEGKQAQEWGTRA